MRPYSVGNYCCDGDDTMMTEAKLPPLIYKNTSKTRQPSSRLTTRPAPPPRRTVAAAAAADELVALARSNCSESTASGMFSWSGLHRGGAPPAAADSVGRAL
uniref:Uncharacterized protein n=1 Tax=Oryza meridionalis TaxID=40149 RepID=A0A0E0ED17_9ORYZ